MHQAYWVGCHNVNVFMHECLVRKNALPFSVVDFQNDKFSFLLIWQQQKKFYMGKSIA